MKDKNERLGELSGWVQRLEAGAKDEATLALAAELRQQRPVAPEPPAEFTAELRQELLDQYERRPAFDLRGLSQGVGTAVALGLLAIAVLATWLAMAQRPGTASITAPGDLAGNTGATDITAVVTPGATSATEAITDTVENKQRDRVWLISAYQAARTSASAPIHFEVVVGYDLVSAPEAVMKLHLANPDWETAGSGRVPIDGVTDFVPVTADRHNATFTFTVNLGELSQIVGTSEPALLVQMGNFVEHDDGRGRELVLYATETFTNLPPSLFALDKPVSTPPDEMGARGTIGMVSIQPDVSPPTETTLTGSEPVTFEAPIFYELSGVPETEIEVSLLKQTTDGVVSAWQALDTKRVPVQAGRGLFQVTFTLAPAVQLRGATTIEVTVGMVVPGSEGYRITNGGVPSRAWRYEP
ncbi:MAG TPA: hypothetical protein VF177_04350 [Anaerolineae bacterium]